MDLETFSCDSSVLSDSKSRRSSNSSRSDNESRTSTCSSFESTDNEQLYTLTEVEISRLCRVINSEKSNAFSTLSELAQIKFIHSLTYEDCGQVSEGWSGSVQADLVLGHSFRGYAIKTSKQDAKKAAAAVCFGQMKEMLELYATHPWPFNIMNEESKMETAEIRVTTKQKLQMQEDQQHLQVLDAMSFLQRSSENNAVLLSMDVETYERTGKEILEVGLSWGSALGQDKITSCHLIVEDHLHLSNGLFCPDNRWNFNFGQSELVRECDLLQNLTEKIQSAVHGADTVYFVGHSPQHDYTWLGTLGMDMKMLQFQLCDVARAHRAMISATEYHNLMSLGRIMELMGLEVQNPHNGGNDARYHIEVACGLMNQRSR